MRPGSWTLYFEWFVALRYLCEGRTQTAFTLAAVSVGVGVIVFLSALMNGLQASLIRQTLGSQAHVVIRPLEATVRQVPAPGLGLSTARVEKPPERLRAINQWQHVLATARLAPHVTAVSPTVAGAAFVSRGHAVKSVALRGIDADSFDRIISLRARMRAGSYRVGGSDVLIGVELADQLGVGVGDKLRLESAAAAGRTDVFGVAGIFDLGNKDVNERWVLVSLRAGQTLLDLAGGISTIEVTIDRIFEGDRVARDLADRTGLVADSWMKVNQQLLIGLKSQDSSKYMIQFFVIVAAALGIASVLAVSVVQKAREIGIMRAVGTSRRRVMRIFLMQGLVVGLLGSALGSLLGAALALFFATLARNPDGSPTFPVDLSPSLFARAALIALMTGLLAAVIPARRAARLDPAVTIHNG
ncbi:MAG TPA: ABC transporter permease [Polyangia bacterium]